MLCRLMLPPRKYPRHFQPIWVFREVGTRGGVAQNSFCDPAGFLLRALSVTAAASGREQSIQWQVLLHSTRPRFRQHHMHCSILRRKPGRMRLNGDPRRRLKPALHVTVWCREATLSHSCHSDGRAKPGRRNLGIPIGCYSSISRHPSRPRSFASPRSTSCRWARSG